MFDKSQAIAQEKQPHGQKLPENFFILTYLQKLQFGTMLRPNNFWSKMSHDHEKCPFFHSTAPVTLAAPPPYFYLKTQTLLYARSRLRFYQKRFPENSQRLII